MTGFGVSGTGSDPFAPTATPTPTATFTETPTATRRPLETWNPGGPIETETPTSTMIGTATATETPSIPVLNDFGIQLVEEDASIQPWSTIEQANILNGAIRTADAFTLFGTVGTTLADRFKTVMGNNLTFLRLLDVQPQNSPYALYYSTDVGVCQVFDPTVVITNIVIACRGGMLQTNTWITNGQVTEYAVVHEFGHVVDIRSGTQLREYVGHGSLSLVACDGERVMGVAAGGLPWVRGQRGWGSSDPDSADGQEISQFQQNPYSQTDPIETAADMFLNWVYRRTSDIAPAGIPANFDPVANANPAPTDACNYAETGTWEGFLNIDRVGSLQTNTRTGNVRY